MFVVWSLINLHGDLFWHCIQVLHNWLFTLAQCPQLQFQCVYRNSVEPREIAQVYRWTSEVARTCGVLMHVEFPYDQNETVFKVAWFIQLLIGVASFSYEVYLLLKHH